MLVINLRRADGRELPFQLQIRSAGHLDLVEFIVVATDSQEVLSCETFHRDLIPLSRFHPDLHGTSMVIGCQPEHDLMLIEFGGRDGRLCMAGLGEIRSAVNVASWSTRKVVAA